MKLWFRRTGLGFGVGALALASTLVSGVAHAQAAAPSVTTPEGSTGAPAAAGVTTTTTPADAAPPWQERLDEIDRRTRALETQNAAAAPVRADNAHPVAAGPISQADENGFTLVSGDRNFQVRFKGLLQFDGRAFLGDSALSPLNTFVVRKIRPILAGTLLGLTDFYFSPDFGNGTSAGTGTVIVADAFLDTHPFPWLRFRVGKFKQAYGLERLEADQDLTFIERALDQYLTPQREVGVQVWGDVAGGILRYEGSVTNGNPDNSIGDVDTNGPKTLGGRVFIQPFNTDALRGLGRLGVGFAASTGTELGTAAAPQLGSAKSAGQNTIFAYLTSTTDTTLNVFASGRHTRLNPQIYYYNGPFGLLGEWVKEYQEVQQAKAKGAYNNQAGHITASAALGGDVTFEGVKPHHPLDVAAGTYGALELGVRYDWIKLDDAAFPTGVTAASVHEAKSFGVALNWQLSRNLKLSGNYEETTFTGGLAKGADRKSENALIGRFQTAF
jgi:phosphate-selective porin OprO/OprP